jgi:hypothetical protein
MSCFFLSSRYFWAASITMLHVRQGARGGLARPLKYEPSEEQDNKGRKYNPPPYLREGSDEKSAAETPS